MIGNDCARAHTRAVQLQKLYHFAYPCRDAEETRHFYEDILGVPLVHCMLSERVPSSAEQVPYAHFFFELGDGSYIAFFDLGRNVKPQGSPNTPAWVQHFAMETDSVETVLSLHERLKSFGVEVVGPVDHGFVRSIYFFDPNGLRLEIAARTEAPGFLATEKARAHEQMKQWSLRKAQLLQAG
jgi:catechol 2,3-dioxygenase-like lactoylglutathione lyase family enzyme